MKNFATTMRELALAKGINFDEMIIRVVPDHVMQVNKVAKDLSDTEWHQAFIVNANSEGYTFADDDRPERLMKAFFAAVSAYLSKVKVAKIDEAAALVINDIAGNTKFVAIAEYHENENPDEPGNWSLVYSFDEADLVELEKDKTVKRYLCNGEDFRTIFNRVAYDIQCIDFSHSNYMYDACLLVIDTIIQVLDREAVEGDTVDVELPQYFIASVAVEAGEKVFGIVPDGFMKEILKDDIALEAAGERK